MSDAFTLRIFVPSGDPAGTRIVDRMNWTGRGFFVPRADWAATRTRDELGTGGVYVLIGYDTDELGNEFPIAYIGQTDNLRKRIDQHDAKEFWETAVFFLSTAGGLNRAHTTWLEWALIAQAAAAKRCRLINGVVPAEPRLIESEKADTRGFLAEMLRLMPVMGVHLFEPAKVVVAKAATASALSSALPAPAAAAKDVIVVPAQKEGFERAYLGADAWWAIRVAAKHRDALKWIAAYQVSPVAAVTHLAEIERLEPFGDEGKFKVVFKGPAEALPHPIPYADAPPGAMQGPRYTSLAALRAATTVKDLI